MKTTPAIIRWLVAPFWLLLVAFVALRDAMREASLKRRLGSAYEGPLED